MASSHSANVQSSVPEYKNTQDMVCFLEKILVLDKLYSNMSDNAVGQSCMTLCDSWKLWCKNIACNRNREWKRDPFSLQRLNVIKEGALPKKHLEVH